MAEAVGFDEAPREMGTVKVRLTTYAYLNPRLTPRSDKRLTYSNAVALECRQRVWFYWSCKRRSGVSLLKLLGSFLVYIAASTLGIDRHKADRSL